MNCNVVATGSSGNCVILNDSIAIDMGVPYKRVAPCVKVLRLVLLTHQHRDHFKPETIRRLAQERPALRFGCCAWMIRPLVEAGVEARSIDVYDLEKSYTYGSMDLSAFPLVHDVENCGYKLNMDGEQAIYATDTFTLEGIAAPGFDLYMIEANFTDAEIAERIQRKLGAGAFVYEYRAAAGHLSREKADAWLAENTVPGKSKVVYLHGHREDKRCGITSP